MTQDGLLEWNDLRRGLTHLARKARPLARSVHAMLTQKPTDKVSLGSVLETQAAAHPTRPAIKSADGTLSYRELNERANRLANYLRKRGLRRGDSVAVFMENRPAVLVAVAGLAKVGAIAGMVNTNQRKHVLVHSFRCCEPSFYLIGQELTDAFDEVKDELDDTDGLALFVAEDDFATAPEGYVDLREELRRSPPFNPPTTGEVELGDAVFYIFTSGTTGLPKASIMTHKRWVSAHHAFNGMCLGLDATDTLYVPLPLYHNNALTVAWSSAMGVGAALAIRRKFSVSEFWDDCRRFHATSFCYIGEIPRYLLNRPESPADRDHSVVKILGNGLRPDIWDQFKHRFGIREIYEFYAASEMNIAFFNAMNLDRTVGFCPLPVWDMVAFDVDAGEPIRDASGRMRKVGKGETGLVISKVNEKFQFDGYTDKAASEKKLFRDVFQPGDCWFNSGDLCRNIGFGHLQFVDRVGDTFRWKAENVSTGEVEHVINAADGIAESTVYGVTIPQHDGRAGMAAVVPSNGTSTDVGALLATMRDELPRYAIPVFVRVTDTLQTTGTFKHRKVDLRKDAYDPTRSDDPVYVLLPRSDEYTRVTPEIFAEIQKGAYNF